MKITRFSVMDPLDWGTRDRPYLLVAVEEPLRNPKERQFADYEVIQYGPFFDLVGSPGRFNTLDPSFHSPRLIEVQLQVHGGVPTSWKMDLKRARYELKKVQRIQEWSIRLDQAHTERTGEAIYVPVKRLGNQCGGWITEEPEHRCSNKQDLTLTSTKAGLPIFLCPTHLAAERRDQFARRVAS